jgi:ligand-binding SRPBCC domain-containing protein
MPRFTQRFRVNLPLQGVWELHDDVSTLSALTPPPLTAKMIRVDTPLRKGSNVIFRLSLLGIGPVWHAVYDEYEPYAPGKTRCWFVDRAESAPFSKWTHRHTFDDCGDGTSTVTDDATFELISGGVLAAPINWLVAYPAVVSMFLYRRIKTGWIVRGMNRKK